MTVQRWLECSAITVSIKTGGGNKRIIPFCTNEGSGIGDSVRDIQKICKGADVDSGASFTGSRVSSSEDKIAEWAKSKL